MMMMMQIKIIIVTNWCSSLSLCRILFRTLNHQYDYTFDWTMLKQLNAPQNNMIKVDNREKEKQHTTEAPKIIN